MIKTIFMVIVFAVSFAFVEAAVVVYLRHLLGAAAQLEIPNEILFLIPGITFLEPETAGKIIANTAILNVERIREAATLVMLTSVAAISGKKLIGKIAFFFLSFGVWDIFYYIFLRLAIGWPKSFTDLDIFFLLPTPWVGPVIVPIAISSILIIVSLFYLIKFKK